MKTAVLMKPHFSYLTPITKYTVQEVSSLLSAEFILEIISYEVNNKHSLYIATVISAGSNDLKKSLFIQNEGETI